MQAEAAYAEPEIHTAPRYLQPTAEMTRNYPDFFLENALLDVQEIFGLDESASEKDIKDTFRRLSKTCHPDLHPGDKVAEFKFRQLSRAHEIIKDPQKMATYKWLREQLIVREPEASATDDLDDVSHLSDDIIFGREPDPMDPRTNGPNIYTREYEYTPFYKLNDPANPPSWFTGLLAGRFGYNAAKGVRAPWPEVANISTIRAFVEACGNRTNDLRGAAREILKLLETVDDELLVQEVARMAIDDFIVNPHQRGMDLLFLSIAKRDPNLVEAKDITDLLATDPQDKGTAEQYHARKNAKAALALALLKNDPRLVTQSQFAIKQAAFSTTVVRGNRKIFQTFFSSLRFTTQDIAYLNKRILKLRGTQQAEHLETFLRDIRAAQPELVRDYLHQMQSSRPGFAL